MLRRFRKPILTAQMNSSAKQLDRKLHWLPLSVAIITSFANVAVFIVMAYSNCQTREQIGIQQDALELQRRNAAHTDSTVAVLQEWVLVQKEANDLQNTLNRITQQHIGVDYAIFMDENRPEVILAKIDCFITPDNHLKLVLNYLNNGNSSITDVILKYSFRDVTTREIVHENSKSYAKLAPQKPQISPIFLQKSDYIAVISFRWTWPAISKVDSAIFVRKIIVNEKAATCGCYTM